MKCGALVHAPAHTTAGAAHSSPARQPLPIASGHAKRSPKNICSCPFVERGRFTLSTATTVCTHPFSDGSSRLLFLAPACRPGGEGGPLRRGNDGVLFARLPSEHPLPTPAPNESHCFRMLVCPQCVPLHPETTPRFTVNRHVVAPLLDLSSAIQLFLVYSSQTSFLRRVGALH